MGIKKTVALSGDISSFLVETENGITIIGRANGAVAFRTVQTQQDVSLSVSGPAQKSSFDELIDVVHGKWGLTTELELFDGIDGDEEPEEDASPEEIVDDADDAEPQENGAVEDDAEPEEDASPDETEGEGEGSLEEDGETPVAQ